MNAAFAIILELALAILLVAAAVIDARTYTIANRLNLAIALLAPLHWWASGTPLWPDSAIHLAVAALVFGCFAGFFYLGQMGGGDVKLAAAVALWLPPLATMRVLFLMALAGGVLTLAVLLRHRLRQSAGRPRIPYGVAIAAGGLAILAQPYLNQFA